MGKVAVGATVVCAAAVCAAAVYIVRRQMESSGEMGACDRDPEGDGGGLREVGI